jgi:hypothetical protein
MQQKYVKGTNFYSSMQAHKFTTAITSNLINLTKKTNIEVTRGKKVDDPLL